MSLSFPYTFKLNNTDLGARVERYGYETSYTPVYSDPVTTMDKVDHTVIVRWRHGLTVKLKPQSEAELNALQTALLLSNVQSVNFSSLQLNQDVTCNMTVSPDSVALVLKNASRRVLGEITLTFTEL